MSRSIDLKSAEAFFNRELSWLNFARRVLALVENPELPLMERVKFAGIMGMLHDEFFMKRMSGLKRQIARNTRKLSLDGRTPAEEFAACRAELLDQTAGLDRVIAEGLRPALAGTGLPILSWGDLGAAQRKFARKYFETSVEPILTPLAVDAEHPFPFISHGGLNLAVVLPDGDAPFDRFVRIKVPDNRPRWVELPGGAGVVPLEQVIAHNLDLVLTDTKPEGIYVFRVTRGASGILRNEELAEDEEDDPLAEPGSIVQVVSDELKARRFAGVVRLQVEASMPKKLVKWLASQLDAGKDDIYRPSHPLALKDFGELRLPDRPEAHYPEHRPATHPRLRRLEPEPAAIFGEIAAGDILLHHPYHSFDDSVLRFLNAAALDPQVLAIKLTVYRTGSDSPIIRALVEAARRGKQVAVLVEITARFDEAPNIAWGRHLENEGCHVAYGVERLKTHVKLALVIREEAGGIRRYAHIGTGNYHVKTARLYEDLGLLTCDEDLCDDVAMVFNSLTGAMPPPKPRKLIVAPEFMRKRFYDLIRREARHARAGRPCGIQAKMNQLQDPDIIRELYRAGRAGVPIRLWVRGLCCLRPGVPGLSENIRVSSVVGRYLEHSRAYRFVNGGDEELYIGSADWMKRNLDRRVETVTPILDPRIAAQLAETFEIYEIDNDSAWDCGPDGRYVRRTPAAGEERRSAQEILARRAADRGNGSRAAPPHALGDPLSATS